MIRKAKISDAKDIHVLNRYWAKKGKVLERSLNYIYENIRDFWVCVESKKIIACCAFGVIGWESLGEIKSLSVHHKHQGQKIGKKLVEVCIKEAGELGIENIFALTFSPIFFKKLGFKNIDRKKLPHKIWNDCINCCDFPDCNEEAFIFKAKRRK